MFCADTPRKDAAVLSEKKQARDDDRFKGGEAAGGKDMEAMMREEERKAERIVLRDEFPQRMQEYEFRDLLHTQPSEDGRATRREGR